MIYNLENVFIRKYNYFNPVSYDILITQTTPSNFLIGVNFNGTTNGVIYMPIWSQWNDIVNTGNVWWVIDNNGNLYRSSDGRIWNYVAGLNITNPYIYPSPAGATMFICSPTSNTYYYSQTPYTTFTQRTAPVGCAFSAMIYANGYVCGFGGSSNNQIYYATLPNAISGTWTFINVANVRCGLDTKDCFCNATSSWVGLNGTSSIGIYTTNPTSWTICTGIGCSFNNNGGASNYFNARWIQLANDGIYSTPAYLTVPWVKATTIPSFNFPLNTLEIRGSAYAYVITKNSILQSNNAQTWTNLFTTTYDLSRGAIYGSVKYA